MTNHTYTPQSPAELARLQSGEQTSVWVSGEQPYSIHNGRPYKKVRETISVYEAPMPVPYQPGDTLVVWDTDDAYEINDTIDMMPIKYHFPILTSTAEQRGEWGWKITLERKETE